MEKTYVAKNESAYQAICKDILDNRTYNIFFLEGDLGAGKTTMVKQFLALLGSKDTISSPTFSIVNQYNTPNGPCYHFDLYRLEDIEEVLDIGMEEYLYSDQLCFIEWPGILAPLDLTEVHKIQIEHLDNSHRRINFI